MMSASFGNDCNNVVLGYTLRGHMSMINFLRSRDVGRDETTDSKSTSGMARTSTSDFSKKVFISKMG